MTEGQRGETLRTLERLFGDRVKRRTPLEGETPRTEGAPASVLPINAEEVRVLVEVAGCFSVPLVALGGETAAEAAAEKAASLSVST